MNPRSEDNCCELTTSLWKGTSECTEEINKGFSDCVTSASNDPILCCLACLQPEIPLVLCASWLLCCLVPPAGALALTPVTGLIDCSIFSVRKIGELCNPASMPLAPPQQTMY